MVIMCAGVVSSCSMLEVKRCELSEPLFALTCACLYVQS